LEQVQPLRDRWKKLTTGSINRQIFGAAVTVASMTVLVQMAFAGRELVVALRFGTGDALDAFLIAVIIPLFIIDVVAGSFNSALIPTYIQVREQEGATAAQRLFSGVMVWSLGLLTITTVLVILAAPLYLPLVARGFSPQKLDLTYRIVCLISPMVFLNGIKVIWSAILNARERFALAAIVPIITPTLSSILLLICPSWGIFALVTGLVSGAMLELIILGIILKRQKVSLIPRWYGFDPHLRVIAGQYAPMIIGSFLMSSTNLVDQSMAAMLSPGSVAALNYGNKVIAFLLGVSSTALGTAVIPYFSNMVTSKDWRNVRQTHNKYMKLIFIVTVPLTIFIVLISEPLVEVLFQRGAFTSESTKLVAQVQSCFAFQIPFYVSGILVVRLISSIRANHILMWAAVFNLLINISLNYLFIQWLGVQGIALSTSCVYFFCLLFVSYCLNKYWQSHKYDEKF
jgi:putative peptidoglycan lipid II flippase